MSDAGSKITVGQFGTPEPTYVTNTDSPEWMRSRIQVLEEAARAVTSRMLVVYRPEYIERCVQHEPDSLLALVKRLEAVAGEELTQ